MDKKTLKHILNVLRQGTITWNGRSDCLRRSRKKVQEGFKKDGDPKYKFYWQCALCKVWDREESSMEVDHKIEVGSYLGNLHDYALRMYDAGNLQALCKSCHQKKTSKFNATLRYSRKLKTE